MSPPPVKPHTRSHGTGKNVKWCAGPFLAEEGPDMRSCAWSNEPALVRVIQFRGLLDKRVVEYWAAQFNQYAMFSIFTIIIVTYSLPW